VDFKNKVILITGASSGIGKQTAIEFAKKGANLVLLARRKDKLELVAKELEKFHTTILVCQCDVSNKDQVKEMSKTVLEKFDTIDILVNNAGFAIYGTVTSLSIEEIESQMETNYFGMIYCIKNFLPSMIEKKSLGFSEGLKHELKGTGVGITVVSPIMVRTDFFDHPSFEKMPKFSPTSLSSKTVANAIIKAANSTRLEIIVPSVVRGAVWFKHTFPYLINPILGKAFKNLSDSKK